MNGLRRFLDVAQSRRAAECRERLARPLVTQLRLVAEREQRLATAGLGICLRDRDHVGD